jgi:hypothetical protein
MTDDIDALEAMTLRKIDAYGLTDYAVLDITNHDGEALRSVVTPEGLAELLRCLFVCTAALEPGDIMDGPRYLASCETLHEGLIEMKDGRTGVAFQVGPVWLLLPLDVERLADLGQQIQRRVQSGPSRPTPPAPKKSGLMGMFAR